MIQPGKYELLTQSWFNVGPPSVTPAWHQIIIGPTSRVCWEYIVLIITMHTETVRHRKQTKVDNSRCACVQVHMRRTYLCNAGSSRKHRTINIPSIGMAVRVVDDFPFFCYNNHQLIVIIEDFFSVVNGNF